MSVGSTGQGAAPLVVVTGASSGIGAALVRSVPWGDAEVLGVSRRPPAPPARHLALDLAEPASWAALAVAVAEALDRHPGGRVVVVHAAGTLEPMGFAAQVDPEAYERAVLLGAATMALGQRLLGVLARHDAPRHLVLLTSGAARTVYLGWSAYGAAKAAMDQWCRIVGAEEAERGGVRILAVTPGPVDTPMQAAIRAASAEAFPARERFAELHRLDQLPRPEVVAERIWALLDEDLPSGTVLDLRHQVMEAAGTGASRKPGPAAGGAR
ncbi:SDR family NAD(P)-dependent oxidoreductase [Aciditerrimonas ferrireducens]|jgi:NAD(P)-dependent dehydrogenase (short-subunit alcohol dehydrogenase family)|uniref:SDR family NAD(P)-dependent oxidoreductase n=1 Tax=Aciditerrimonas ferrireducens TaxID=667306 RepID=UPI002004706F|nr:SDR family NAD(P)-dependent oxidoreductase [Aciditerrimonas ferrireducens]MCK4177758.1 SDR family NAD(P)-dependent oxidoreductase [Aciditerrimonas ferrireducens]